MQALQYWKAVTMDRSDFLERILSLFDTAGIRFCVIGGQGVNAYAEPVVSLDLDLVVALDDIVRAEALLRKTFEVKRFEHSINVASAGSKIRVQIQTDPRYATFVSRARIREILDLHLPVAAPEDVLQGKIWAVQDSARRPSKQLKDLSDIARLIEVHRELRDRVPPEVLARIPQ